MTFEEIRNVAHNHLEAPKNVANKLAEVYFSRLMPINIITAT